MLFVPVIQYNRIPHLISTQLICQSIYLALSLAMLFLTDWFSLTCCTLVPIWAQCFQLLDISVMFEVVSSKFGNVRSFDMFHPKLSSINESACEASRQLVNCQAHRCSLHINEGLAFVQHIMSSPSTMTLKRHDATGSSRRGRPRILKQTSWSSVTRAIHNTVMKRCIIYSSRLVGEIYKVRVVFQWVVDVILRLSIGCTNALVPSTNRCH